MARRDPHFKVFVSLPRHRRTARIFQSDAMLATYSRLGLALVEAFAQLTEGAMAGPEEIAVKGRVFKAAAWPRYSIWTAFSALAVNWPAKLPIWRASSSGTSASTESSVKPDLFFASTRSKPVIDSIFTL